MPRTYTHSDPSLMAEIERNKNKTLFQMALETNDFIGVALVLAVVGLAPEITVGEAREMIIEGSMHS